MVRVMIVMLEADGFIRKAKALPKAAQDASPDFEELRKANPILSVCAEFAYIGYKLGKRDAEIHRLEEMAGSQ